MSIVSYNIKREENPIRSKAKKSEVRKAEML
jgi:hypothetical protein